MFCGLYRVLRNMDPIALQAKVRNNAMDQQSSLEGLLEWEKKIGGRDASIQSKRGARERSRKAKSSRVSNPIRPGGGSIAVGGTNRIPRTEPKPSPPSLNPETSNTAADHTYDK